MEPSLITERLIIRPRTMNDLEACLAMDRDPLVTQFIVGPWQIPKVHREFLLERMATSYPQPLGYWSVTLIERPDEFLGWVMVLPLDDNYTQAEIGWRLTRQTWGQGIATEATSKVIETLRKAYPKIQLTATIHPDNVGSIKVAKKLGMTFERDRLINDTREQVYVIRPSNV